MVEKALQRECEVSGHIVSTVREREQWMLEFSLLYPFYFLLASSPWNAAAHS